MRVKQPILQTYVLIDVKWAPFICQTLIFCHVCVKELSPPSLVYPDVCVFFPTSLSGPFVSLSSLSLSPSVVLIFFRCQSRCQCGALSDTARLFSHV